MRNIFDQYSQPENKLTYQIGNLPEIATITQLKTVCDFRVQDVALGGQGAPLVPIGDLLLFYNYDACINLGGFSNISKFRKSTELPFISFNNFAPLNLCSLSSVPQTYEAPLFSASKQK